MKLIEYIKAGYKNDAPKIIKTAEIEDNRIISLGTEKARVIEFANGVELYVSFFDSDNVTFNLTLKTANSGQFKIETITKNNISIWRNAFCF